MKKLLVILLLLVPSVCFSQTDSLLRDSLRKAVEELAYHPDSIDLRLRKAGWNLELRQWEYAKDEYDWVLRHEPKNVAALFFRAYANEKLKRYNFARLDYEYLLTIVPGHFEGRLGLALLNQKDHHYRDALDQLNQLCEALPPRAEAFAARAGVEVERKMYELAEYDYEEAIRLSPNNQDYKYLLGEVRKKIKKK